MDTQQIKEKLEELFQVYRIVFWNDPEREFEDILDTLKLDDVDILRPDKMGYFKAKVIIELEQPDKKFLVYSTTPEPTCEDDWLLDIRLYSYQFHADRASMLVDELGLRNHSLRDHLNLRKKFFASKNRTARLKQLLSPDDLDKKIDRKMIAVVVNSEHSDLFDIVRTLYTAVSEEGGLDSQPKVWGQIKKLKLEDVFWRFIRETFSYTDESPTLRNFLTTLFVTDLGHSIKDDLPGSLRHFVLPREKQSNAAVCLGQWRDSSSKAKGYGKLSVLVAEALNVDKILSEMPSDKLEGAVTFLEIEKIIASNLRDIVIETADAINIDEVHRITRKRQDMHWANCHIASTPDVPREALYAVYSAISAAADFFAVKNSYIDGFKYNTAEEMYKAYIGELYKFDQLYRVFCENADIADSLGWGILKPLREKIEAVYCNWYLDSLALQWEKCVSLQSWKIKNVFNQYTFYDVYPAKAAGEKAGRGVSTVYVIISDAFRYEAAEELTRELNGKYRFAAKLESMLGVVPSYTGLGMAALLPHKILGFTEKGDVLVDGKGCSSFQQRKELLAGVNGTTIGANELLSMKREEGKDLVRDKAVVYIYHDIIDARGSSARTEGQTFQAVRDAINNISDIVRYLVNNLYAKYVYVTADHGFLYTEAKPDITDKYNISDKIGDAIKSNKRFFLGSSVRSVESTISGKVSDTAGVDVSNDMSFLVPRGMSRFHFMGGARFIHGGMSLQEVVVAVVKVEQVRGKEKEKTQERNVSVQIMGTSHWITTSQHRFQLLQTDAVSERVKPITIKIAVYDEDTPVTDIKTVTFGSSSENMAERTKWVTLTLQNRVYDKNKRYRCVLRDVETKIEVQSIEVRIDRVFTSDF